MAANQRRSRRCSRRDHIVQLHGGTTLIVHGVNPPNYHNWRGLALPMLDNTIAAARVNNARILLPATIYNFGEDAPQVLKESTPQNPASRKGQVRVEMELKLQEAADYGVRSMVVRAGDFFGPGAGNSWLTRGMTSSSPLLRSVFYPGAPSAGHSWAYVPDLAETMVRLIECERSMEAFEVVHFGGHWFERGADMAELVCRVRGTSPKRIKPFPWWAIKLASPVVGVFREMLEMRYLWQVPLQLNNEKLRTLIGAEPHTPIEIALAATFGNEPAVEPQLRIPA
jgi:nucleoside-diphosphate-sugar epimerase